MNCESFFDSKLKFVCLFMSFFQLGLLTSLYLDKIRALRNWYEQQEDFDSQQQTIQATLDQLREDCAELEADVGIAFMCGSCS